MEQQQFLKKRTLSDHVEEINWYGMARLVITTGTDSLALSELVDLCQKRFPAHMKDILALQPSVFLQMLAVMMEKIHWECFEEEIKVAPDPQVITETLKSWTSLGDHNVQQPRSSDWERLESIGSMIGGLAEYNL